MPKIPLKSSTGNTLYGDTVILDTSLINDPADYGGMLYELKKLNIRDGYEFQIDNASNILMNRDAYKKCVKLLKEFKVKAIN